MRASELATVEAKDLNLAGKPPTLSIQAAYAQNRKQDVLPLPPDVARYLSDWLAPRPICPVGGVRLWSGTWWQRAADMLRIDLAGIDAHRYGQVVDFHARRAAFATNLARLGVNLHTAQALLRHSHPKRTARTYTKLGITDLGETVAGLRLPQLGRKAETGSDPR